MSTWRQHSRNYSENLLKFAPALTELPKCRTNQSQNSLDSSEFKGNRKCMPHTHTHAHKQPALNMYPSDLVLQETCSFYTQLWVKIQKHWIPKCIIHLIIRPYMTRNYPRLSNSTFVTQAFRSKYGVSTSIRNNPDDMKSPFRTDQQGREEKKERKKESLLSSL